MSRNNNYEGLHKPRGEAVRFTSVVKQYLTSKFDLGERTGNKADPGKVAADMRTARNLDGSRMFERKDWLTKSQVQGFFSRLAASRRKQGNKCRLRTYTPKWKREKGVACWRTYLPSSVPGIQSAMTRIACVTYQEMRNLTLLVSLCLKKCSHILIFHFVPEIAKAIL